ncbi:MAG: thioredoxin domain-containing protein, partial [Acidobacteriota bacterium]
GLLTLYETTGELEWLQESVGLTTTMIEEFWDDQEGGFFFTGKSHESLIVRSKDYFDNATPSGNSVASEVLLRLAALTENEDYQRRATSVLRLVSESVRRYPSGFGRALGAIDFSLGPVKEIALIGDSTSQATRNLIKEVWTRYLPNKVVAQAAVGDQSPLALVPLLRDRNLVQNLPTAYVCEHYTCKEPTTDPKKLASQLALPDRSLQGKEAHSASD